MDEMKQKVCKNNLRKRFILELVISTLILTVVLGGGIAYRYTQQMNNYYKKLAFSYASIISEYIDGDTINHYAATLQKDDYYEKVRDFLNNFSRLADLEYCYVVIPNQDEMFYIWDSGQGEGVLDLGDTDDYYGDGDKVMHQAFRDPNKQVILITNNETYGYLASAYVMIPDSTGKPVALACIDISMNHIKQSITTFISMLILIVMIMLAIFIAIYYKMVSISIITPIQKLQLATTNLVKDNQLNYCINELDSINTGNEVEELAHSFKYMMGQIEEYIKNLSTVTAEKERIGAELDIATKIQMDMLPSIFPPYPDCSLFDIYASMTSAKEVGGDFYDFFLIDEDHLALVIADVSGKGIPAALFMVISKTLIKNSTLPGAKPKDILEKVNKQLCENNEASMFVTVWMGILEISTGKITAVNAGHERPVIKKAGGEFEYLYDKHGMMLAALDLVKYKEYEIQLSPGDRLFLYTDGVPEATNANEELLNEERELEILNRHKDEPLSMMLKHIKEDVDLFVGEAPQFDDLTMMVLEYKGKENEHIN